MAMTQYACHAATANRTNLSNKGAPLIATLCASSTLLRVKSATTKKQHQQPFETGNVLQFQSASRVNSRNLRRQPHQIGICQSISTCNSMCTSGISFQGICMCQAHCHSCIQTDTTSFCTVCKDGFLLEGGACVSACQKGSAEIQTGTSFVGFGRICVAGSSAPLLETPSLQFEMAAPTSFTDRMCVDVTMCSVDEYQTVPASYKSDRECTLLQVCGLDQYIDSAAGLDIGYYYGKLADGRTGRQTLYDTDRSCAQLTVCSSLEYESRTPSATSDRLCTTLAECMVGLQFEEQAPSKTSDRICQLITSCPPGEQQSLAATPFRNTVCRACAEGKFKSEPGQATCSDSTVCSASQYESDSLTPVADRQCTSLAGN